MGARLHTKMSRRLFRKGVYHTIKDFIIPLARGNNPLALLEMASFSSSQPGGKKRKAIHDPVVVDDNVRDPDTATSYVNFKYKWPVMSKQNYGSIVKALNKENKLAYLYERNNATNWLYSSIGAASPYFVVSSMQMAKSEVYKWWQLFYRRRVQAGLDVVTYQSNAFSKLMN